MHKKTCCIAVAFFCLALLCHAQVPEYTPLDIEYPDHHLVIRFHNEYSTAYNQARLKEVLVKAAPYRPYIRQQLKERNMPLCLEYLPVIESSFNYRAVSKSGAVGLWQFMENSMGKSLIKNSWADQRLDPWSSTDAALTKLQENYDYFQDWALALAAYNMGLGGLKRIMNSTGCKTYWELVDGGHLRTETMLYVPKFLSVADLITNADYYQIDFPRYDETCAIAQAVITVDQQVDLAILCKEADIDLKQMQFLNSSLLYSVTPYGTSWNLRVPADKVDVIEEVLSSMDACLTDMYVVVKGDTLWGISRKYGITVQELCDANNIRENAILRIGTTLFVPIRK